MSWLHIKAGPLVLFVEKAYKLETSPFWEWITTRRGPPDMERIISGDWLAHDGLTPEVLDSFCLTLRLLIQDQDGFSIRKVLAIAEGWPEPHASHRVEIRRAIDNLHVQLEKPSLVQLTSARDTKNTDLFDVIFYGGIVHANPGKREQFRIMTNAGLFSFFAFQAFSDVLFHYRNCIQTIAFHVVQYLKEAEVNANEG